MGNARSTAGIVVLFALVLGVSTVKAAQVPTPPTTGVEMAAGEASSTIVTTPTVPAPSVHALKCSSKRWKGTHKQWDKIAVATLKSLHCSAAEIRMAMYIHHHEGGPNSINHAGSGCYGGWQLSWGMAHGHRWWCPSWETRRAVRYMRGRYGSIAKAYRFKKSHGWY